MWPSSSDATGDSRATQTMMAASRCLVTMGVMLAYTNEQRGFAVLAPNCCSEPTHNRFWVLGALPLQAPALDVREVVT